MQDQPRVDADPEPLDEGRVYCGVRRLDGSTAVCVDGEPLGLRPDFRTQSTTAFDWGYAGSGGPAQLALAILADHWADDQKARRYYEPFVRCVIRKLPNEGWSMTGGEIDASFRSDAEPPAATGQPSGPSET